MPEQTLEARIQTHLQHIVTGPRMAASPAHHAAADYIESVMQNAGLAAEQQHVPAPRWWVDEASLQVNGQPLTPLPNPYSPSCDVRGEIVPLGTLAQLKAADLSGNIALLLGDLSHRALTPINCPLYQIERDVEINQLLIEKSPAALITVNTNPPASDRIILDHDFPLPSVTVTAEDGLTLVQAAGEMAHLRLLTQREESHANNVIGRKAGQQRARIVIMGHFDTMIDTPGAADNGVGAAAVCALAEELAGADLPASLEFIAFGTEEYLGEGDMVYVREYGDAFDEIILAINLDSVGLWLGTDTVALGGHSPELQTAVEGVVAGYPGVIWRDMWVESNHSTFMFRGVPALVMTTRGMTAIYHQPSDTLGWISPARAAEVVRLVAAIVRRVAGESAAWARPVGEGVAVERPE